MSKKLKQYKRGGWFNQVKDAGKLVVDNSLSTIGMGNLIDDSNYTNKWAKKAAPISDEIGEWGSRVVMTAFNPALGAAVTGVQEGMKAAIGDSDADIQRQKMQAADPNNPFGAAANQMYANVENDNEDIETARRAVEITGQVANSIVGGASGGGGGYGDMFQGGEGAGNFMQTSQGQNGEGGFDMNKMMGFFQKAGNMMNGNNQNQGNQNQGMNFNPEMMQGAMDIISNFFADGGSLNGGVDTNAKLQQYQGPKHEQNGIPVDKNGQPVPRALASAEVEGGETKLDDYVFSERNKVPGTKKAFAKASKEIESKYKSRIESGDKIARQSRRDELTRLMNEQEAYNASQNFGSSMMNSFANGGKLTYQMYEDATGKKWSSAKEEGLTDGSYEQNMALRERIQNGDLSRSENNVENEVIENTDSDEVTFDEAFAKARKEQGSNGSFEWRGKKYGTKYASEVENNIKESKPKSPSDVQTQDFENIVSDNSKKDEPSIVELKNNKKEKISKNIEKELIDKNDNKSNTVPRSKAFSTEALNFVKSQYSSNKLKKDYYFVVDKPTQTIFKVDVNTGVPTLLGKVGIGRNVGDRDVSKGRGSGKGTNMTQEGWVKINREAPFSVRNSSYGDEFNGFAAWVDDTWKEIPTGIHGTEHETEGRVSGGCTRLSCDLEKELSPDLTKGTLIFYTSDDSEGINLNNQEMKNGNNTKKYMHGGKLKTLNDGGGLDPMTAALNALYMESINAPQPTMNPNVFDQNYMFNNQNTGLVNNVPGSVMNWNTAYVEPEKTAPEYVAPDLSGLTRTNRADNRYTETEKAAREKAFRESSNIIPSNEKNLREKALNALRSKSVNNDTELDFSEDEEGFLNDGEFVKETFSDLSPRQKREMKRLNDQAVAEARLINAQKAIGERELLNEDKGELFNEKVNPTAYLATLPSDLKQLLMKWDDPNKYGRLSPNLVNYNAARDEARKQNAVARAIAAKNARNLAGSGLASAAASDAILNSNLGSQLGNLYMQEYNTNQQMRNQYDQLNNQLAIQEDIANRQDRARMQETRVQALENIGRNLGTHKRDQALTEADNKTNRNYYDFMNFISQYGNVLVDKDGRIVLGHTSDQK